MVSRRRFLAVCGLSALAGCAGVQVAEDPADGASTDTTTATRESDATTAGTDRTVEGEGTTTAGKQEQEQETETATDDGDGPALASVTGTWPMLGFDGANTGYNPGATGPDGNEVKQLWRAPFAGDSAPHPPSLADGTIYTQADREVYAFDAVDGSEQWAVDVDLRTYNHTPAVVDGTVYTAAIESSGRDAAGRLFAFDAADGTERWTVDTPAVDSSPKVVDGTLYYLSTGPDRTLTLRAVDVADGSERWSFAAPERARLRAFELWPPAVTDDTVYLTLAGGSAFYALDVADGSVRWSRSFDRRLTTAAAVADGTADLADEDGAAVAVDAATGETVWDRANDDAGPVYVTPAVGDGTVYVADNYRVIALSASTGERRWASESGDNNNNSYITLADDTVYVGGTNVAAFDAADGTVRWAFDTIGAFSLFTGPVVADGVVYTDACVKETAGSRYDHYVYAIVADA